jgi:L-iditol 2-dehydrogenase
MKNLEKFRSAYFFGPKNIKVVNRNIKNINENSLIIKVNSCMICGSDLRIYKEGSKRISKPIVIGHETSGIIVHSKIKKMKVGDKVSLGADFETKSNFAFGYEIDGGFSQYILLKKNDALKAPIAIFNKKISFDEAALAEPLGCCINGFEKVNFKSKKIVTIFGAGPIGLMIALLASKYDSKKIFIVDVNRKRLKVANKILNCKTILLNNKTFVKNFFELNNGKGSDYIFTANPSIETHKFALKIANKKSYINLFGGVSKNNSKLTIDSNFIHYNEINLTGSHGSSHKQHLKALRMIEDKEINLKPLITHKFKLKDINTAYKVSLSGKALKVSIRPN